MILLKNGGGGGEEWYRRDSKGVKRGEFLRKMKRKETSKRPLVDGPNKERYLCGGDVSGVNGHMWLLKNLIFFFFPLDLGWGVTTRIRENYSCKYK